jgi:hypothetical protein
MVMASLLDVCMCVYGNAVWQVAHLFLVDGGCIHVVVGRGSFALYLLA